MPNWQSYFAHWLDKRIPAATSFQLDRHNIFIFPSRFAGLYLLLCCSLFLLGTNYQNNLMLILCYFLVSLLLINLFSAYLNFAKIHLQIGKIHPAYAGESLLLLLWLNAKAEKTKGPNGLLEFCFWGQKDSTVIDADKHCNPLALHHQCLRRGPLSLPRVTVSSYYPLGLFRCWSHLAFEIELVVYPKPLPCAIDLQATSTVSQGGGDSRPIDGHDDFESLKVYQAGEPLHHVAWKQVAKGRGMVSKQFVSHNQQSAWLKLKPCSQVELETQLSHLCFQVLELSRTQQVFGLDIGQNCILPNAGAEHKTACLTALALYGGGESV